MSAIIVPYQAADKDKWNAVVDADPQGWWWQRSEWIDYIDCHPDHRNISFAVSDEVGRYREVRPLFVQNMEIAVEGEPCPVTSWAGEPDRESRRLSIEYAKSILRPGELVRWRFRSAIPYPAVDRNGLIEAAGGKDISWQTQVVEIPPVWSDVRKSYRPLITRAQREYEIGICGKGTSESVMALERYRKLHWTARGGATRSLETWGHMARWLGTGNLMIVLIGWKNPVAGALFIVYKNRAYFASAAQIQPNVEHAAVWMGLEQMNNMDVRWCELGWHARPWDGEKMKNIAFFKRGFGGKPGWIVASEWRTDGYVADRTG